MWLGMWRSSRVGRVTVGDHFPPANDSLLYGAFRVYQCNLTERRGLVGPFERYDPIYLHLAQRTSFDQQPLLQF